MEIRPEDEVRDSIIRYANELLSIQLRKKELDEEAKDLKESFKEDGVPVSVVNKVINIIKNKKKKTESELFEIETIEAWLESDKSFDNNLSALMSK